MAIKCNKKLTNIEKLKNCNMDNKIIINPPKSFNNLLYEKHGPDNFRITAYNPEGISAITIAKDIGLLELSAITYHILKPGK